MFISMEEWAPIRKSPHEEQSKDVQWNEVDDEDVAAPRRHHVEVRQGSSRSPHHRARLHRLDPQVVGEEERENGNALVVVGTGHGA